MKTVTTTEMTCCACGTTYAMDEVLKELRRKDGAAFYCPNGHGQHFADSEEKQLQDRNSKIAELESELSDTKTEVTRLKCELLKYTKPKNFIQRIFK